MKVKTYYWELNKKDVIKNRIKKAISYGYYESFNVGNAGDIYVKDLIKYLYNTEVCNTKKYSNRILLVGSIAHLAKEGDVLAGIGFKNPDYKIKNPEKYNILGVRGPISYDYFKNQGCDMKDVKFQLDPGLMAKFMVKDLNMKSDSADVIFIPHFRERELYRNNCPKGIKFVDIDDYPLNVFQAILNAKMVYTSSLHGVIFSHALNRPCHLISTQTPEPEIKYKDYYSSVNLDYKKPKNNISEVNFLTDSDTPFDLKLERTDFDFPSIEDLESYNILLK